VDDDEQSFWRIPTNTVKKKLSDLNDLLEEKK